MWCKKNSKDLYIDIYELKELTAASPAKKWVNLLLMHMYKESINTYTLDQSQGIPPLPQEKFPEGELSFDGIINRLKVMAGLDPVIYSSPKKGSASLGLGGILYTADMKFDHSNGKSSCSITLSTEGKSMHNQG